MKIEVVLVISVISLTFSLYQGIISIRRNGKTDARQEASGITTVIVKLENIALDIAEIKSDLRDVRNDVKNHAEKLIRLETQIKLLNKTVFGDNSQ